MDAVLQKLEDEILTRLEGKFIEVKDDSQRRDLITSTAKSIDIDITPEQVEEIVKDVNDFSPITSLINDENIEDVMVNNVNNIFYYGVNGLSKFDKKFDDLDSLNTFVKKLRLYATNSLASDNIADVHLPNGSRANIVKSPLGSDITIRNFRSKPLSVIELVNLEELDYAMAARLWLYVDGLKVRPANVLIGGMPASGKTTLLNAMFSFFRPDERIVTIEETYELNTDTQENCVRLETNVNLTTQDLVKNALRMRPDMIIVGEVRGEEANDMMTAMNIGKISLGTIHASSARDIINRLEHTPMNVPIDIIPVIDALIIVSVVFKNGKPKRSITQITEISGIESDKVLLSDLYKYDYKSQAGTPILPSVTYRDTLARLLGIPPSDILAEEKVRAKVLERMNQMGKRGIKDISEMAKKYYMDPDGVCQELGITDVQPVIRL